jgi:hypothetical protein
MAEAKDVFGLAGGGGQFGGHTMTALAFCALGFGMSSQGHSGRMVLNFWSD